MAWEKKEERERYDGRNSAAEEEKASPRAQMEAEAAVPEDGGGFDVEGSVVPKKEWRRDERRRLEQVLY